MVRSALRRPLGGWQEKFSTVARSLPLAVLVSTLLLSAAAWGEPRIKQVEIGFGGRVIPAPERHLFLTRQPPTLRPSGADFIPQGEEIRLGILAPVLTRPAPPTPFWISFSGLGPRTSYQLEAYFLTPYKEKSGGILLARWEIDQLREEGAIHQGLLYFLPSQQGPTEIEFRLKSGDLIWDRVKRQVRPFGGGAVRVLWLRERERPAAVESSITLPRLGSWQGGTFAYRYEFVSLRLTRLPLPGALSDFAALVVADRQLATLPAQLRRRLRSYVALGGILVVAGEGINLPRVFPQGLRWQEEGEWGGKVARYFDGYLLTLPEEAGGEEVADALDRLVRGWLKQMARPLDEIRVRVRDGRYAEVLTGGQLDLRAIPFYRDSSDPGGALPLPDLLSKDKLARTQFQVTSSIVGRSPHELYLPRAEITRLGFNPWWAIHDATLPAPPHLKTGLALEGADQGMIRLIQALRNRVSGHLARYVAATLGILLLAGLVVVAADRPLVVAAAAAGGAALAAMVPPPASSDATFTLAVVQADLLQPREALFAELRVDSGFRIHPSNQIPTQVFGYLADSSWELRAWRVPPIVLTGSTEGALRLVNRSSLGLENALLVVDHFAYPLGRIGPGGEVRLSLAETGRVVEELALLDDQDPPRKEVVERNLAFVSRLDNRAKTYVAYYEYLFQPMLGHYVFSAGERSLTNALDSLTSGQGWLIEGRGPEVGMTGWVLTEMWLEGFLAGRLDPAGTYLIALTSEPVGSLPTGPLDTQRTLLILRLDLPPVGGER